MEDSGFVESYEGVKAKASPRGTETRRKTLDGFFRTAGVGFTQERRVSIFSIHLSVGRGAHGKQISNIKRLNLKFNFFSLLVHNQTFSVRYQKLK